MSIYYESLKPVSKECTIEKWKEHALKIRSLLEGKDGECRDLRNESRRLRFETGVKKSWDLYLNNVRLHDRAYETEVLILYAENMLPKIANEKTQIEIEKFQTETLMQNCDTWICVCMDGLNCLDKKLENEMTRNDQGVIETKKEIKLLEEAKNNLKNDTILAWETACKLEDIETRLELNLEFKTEVLKIDERCQKIDKMDTGVSFKVEPTKGPEKILSIEEWKKAVEDLVQRAENEILNSMKMREKMMSTRGVSLNEYAIQFDKTDYEMRKRVYEINREKNECQFQLYKVGELMKVTKAEWTRLELFLNELKNDLRCAETRCTDRYFRPSVDATMDPPFIGMNKEVVDLQAKVEEVQQHLDAIKAFYNKCESDSHKLFLESEAKNKALQVQVQALDIRIGGRYDPKGIYAYDPNALLSKMVTQLPPPFTLYSNKY